MPIRRIPILAGVVYHVTNRARDGLVLFQSRTSYLAFIDVVAEIQVVRPIRVLAFCIMSNHWHFVLWPETKDAVRAFAGRLSLRHAKRFNRWHGTTGSIYPQRFEARPVQSDKSLCNVIRYVERNPCAAGLVTTPGAYPWSSAAASGPLIPLSDWPVPRPRDWKSLVAQPIESAELLRIRGLLKQGPQRRLRGPDRFEW